MRIFVGTEPAQQRAERVLLWSIERVRDPGRVYQIHLMKQLDGFRTLFWNTGFTNYRFAVPHFAGATGRAIYNDVDQVYLADPAELFDLDLGPHGYLAVSETDTSVMLMDCARMARFWTLGGAQRRRKYGLIRQARAVEATAGPLPRIWNARDDEYRPGCSKLLHYTTIHKQPWRPFPERFVYQEHRHAELWFDLEKQAREAGFNVFRREQPSEPIPLLRHRADGAEHGTLEAGHELDAAICNLIDRSKARSLLRATLDGESRGRTNHLRWKAVPVEQTGLFASAEADAPRPLHDGVICTADLEKLPVDDIPWIVAELFERARRFVFVAVRCPRRAPRHRYTQPPRGSVHEPDWWASIFESAAARHPQLHWEVAFTRGADFDQDPVEYRQGGRFLGATAPSVWVLTDHKPGHTTQSIGLAEELGWPYRRVDLDLSIVAELPNSLLGASRLGLKPRGAARLVPPWPDLVIATGRRTAPVASWIRGRSRGRTRTVQIGRIGAFLGNRFDLALAPSYACLYPDPRRIEMATPLNRVRPSALEHAAIEWKNLFDRSRYPRIALLVGGGDPMHELTPEVAGRLGRDVAEMARNAGGSVFTTTSRRTSRAAAAALREALGEVSADFHDWSPNQPPERNPYMGYLALADVLVVTGESASMLAEGCATGKSVYIYPLPESGGLKGFVGGLLRAGADLVLARAYARPTNRRQIERPQRGLELLCAQLVARGLVRPNRDIHLLHEALVEQGVAHYFDGSCAPAQGSEGSEVSEIADRVRTLLGVPCDPDPDWESSSLAGEAKGT